MPQRDTSGFGERVPRELIDADFEVAFSLVEMAATESNRGNVQLTSQLLQRAEGILGSIRERLLRLDVSRSQPIDARCVELSEAIESARITDESGT
jgi:hypothetical protein